MILKLFGITIWVAARHNPNKGHTHMHIQGDDTAKSEVKLVFDRHLTIWRFPKIGVPLNHPF